MTMAVCAECGAIKWGALTRCKNCGFEPSLDVDRAKAIVLSDHHLPHEELERVGERLAAGEGYEFPEELLEAYVREYEVNPPEKLLRRRLAGCAIRALVLVAVAAAVLWLASYLLSLFGQS